jgi:hypothetical protein
MEVGKDGNEVVDSFLLSDERRNFSNEPKHGLALRQVTSVSQMNRNM